MDYHGDIAAGAVVGVAVAGGLYVLPTRRLIQAVAGRAGVAWGRRPRPTADHHQVRPDQVPEGGDAQCSP